MFKVKSKINILLLFITYLLSVAHNVIPHEHIPIELCNNNCNQTQSIKDLVSIENFNDLLNSFDINHNHNHNKDEKLPFPHCHILLGHDNNQIRSEFSFNIHHDIYFIKETILIDFKLLNFVFSNFEDTLDLIKPKDYSTFNSLRAPPFIS